MLRLLQEAEDADLRKGSINAGLWRDEDAILGIRHLAELSEDPRHVASVHMYQAHTGLQMEYLKKREQLGRLLASQTAFAEIIKLVLDAGHED